MSSQTLQQYRDGKWDTLAEGPKIDLFTLRDPLPNCLTFKVGDDLIIVSPLDGAVRLTPGGPVFQRRG